MSLENIALLGGKGSGLVWLERNKDMGYIVPQFEIIETSVDLDQLDDRCGQLCDIFSGRKVAIRSSAVGSEDNERFSGAGIYDTFFINSEDLTPLSVEEKARRVYDSVGSQKAVKYRAEADIEDERMAVVIQEFMDGPGFINGVFQSRLQAVPGVVPISWSQKVGAVVGSTSEPATVHTIYYRNENEKKFRSVFESDTDIPDKEEKFVETRILPLIRQFTERYGRDFEAEFSADVKNGILYMIQIRPLTNISNQTIVFPDKEPIFSAQLCMGVGEYIGPWITPMEVGTDLSWREPTHYAYFTSQLDKTLAGRIDKNYDALTPNKKAIVITGGARPGLHALTIANERGIICVANESVLSSEEFRREHGYDQASLVAHGGEAAKAILLKPVLDVPLEVVGKYVHVVSNGLEGHVYRATEAEALSFEKSMFSKVRYIVTPIEGWGESDDFFDWSFTVIPDDQSTYRDVVQDFIRHLEAKTGEHFRLDVSPAKNAYGLMSPKAEFEVYTAFFSPSEMEDGIMFSTGRSPNVFANKETTRQWFQEFIDKIQTPRYNPKQG